MYNFRIYEPTSDWAGIGYNHWMICTETDGRRESGVGHTIVEAWNDLKNIRQNRPSLNHLEEILSINNIKFTKNNNNIYVSGIKIEIGDNCYYLYLPNGDLLSAASTTLAKVIKKELNGIPN